MSFLQFWFLLTLAHTHASSLADTHFLPTQVNVHRLLELKQNCHSYQEQKIKRVNNSYYLLYCNAQVDWISAVVSLYPIYSYLLPMTLKTTFEELSIFEDYSRKIWNQQEKRRQNDSFQMQTSSQITKEQFPELITNCKSRRRPWSCHW